METPDWTEVTRRVQDMRDDVKEADKIETYAVALDMLVDRIIPDLVRQIQEAEVLIDGARGVMIALLLIDRAYKL